MFDKVSGKADFPKQEESVLRFWKEKGIFKKSVSGRSGAPEFVFYDGPPFATGLPHYGHLLASTIKDVVPRYQTMKGFKVDRVFGWDCHGLPVENEVEKELGINSKREIEALGVEKFNEACRNIVMRYSSEWQSVIERLGRWVDFDDGYRTMDRNYMESIWWVFKTLWDKRLIYESQKIMAYCPRCATPLSNFEVSQAYVEVEDPSVTLRFKLDEHTSILVWTTTPWTLPSNTALAVNSDVDYLEIQHDGEKLILAQNRLSSYFPKDVNIIRKFKGSELLGKKYEPVFSYFSGKAGAFRIINADFVDSDSGTGIVHIAPGFGEDDHAVAVANGIPVVCPIDTECRFTDEVKDYEGIFVKDTNPAIIRLLKESGQLFHRSQFKHSYPHCWRCDSPLIYRGVNTWFLSVESVKDSMIKANSGIKWVPEHLKEGRFGKWLQNARDWAISRNRYWGCPLPIWRNKTKDKVVCFGSIAELEKVVGYSLPDIHKHIVDGIIIASNGDVLERVPEVFDCWFESGAMPYAQKHYPFENKEWVESHFPADFIAEGLDQTRGWFYTLTVLGAALFDKPSFQNVVVNGIVLAEDGKRMSKRLKNYPNPGFIMQACGADAMRLYLLGSPVVRAEDLRFSKAGVEETVKNTLLPLWNAHNFFTTYASIDKWTPTGKLQSSNSLDIWILSQLDTLVSDMRESLDGYDLMSAANKLSQFMDLLNNWYIRLCRRRFWRTENDEDKNNAYETLYHVLMTFCKVAAPIIPFITETLYGNLRSDWMPESIHLCDYPKVDKSLRNADIDRCMDKAMNIINMGRSLRKNANIRIRQPLSKIIVTGLFTENNDNFKFIEKLVMEELNVKKVQILTNSASLVQYSAKANFKKLGPLLGKDMKSIAAIISKLSHEQISSILDGNGSQIELPGRIVNISADDLEITMGSATGLTIDSNGGILVALDTTLTDSLKGEGYAREIVHCVQELRKESGLNVSEKVMVRYRLGPELEKVLKEFSVYIASETGTLQFVKDENLSLESADKIEDFHCCFEIQKGT